MPQINILSIDFDFFIHFSSQQAALYCPDSGIEFPDELGLLCWMTKYATAASGDVDMAALLSPRVSDMEYVKAIIQNQNDPFCMVCDSHANIVNFCLRLYQGNPITIYNIDAHHDGYPMQKTEGDSAPYDCGNWASALLDMRVAEKVHWIAPENEPHSPASNGMMDPRILTSLRLRDLDSVPRFDGIFLCRSGSWSPPHLDTAFLELAHLLVQPEGGWECRLQKGILENRYNKDFLHGVEDIRRYCPPRKARAVRDDSRTGHNS